MVLSPTYPVLTGRLYLRPLRRSDGPALVAYRSQPDVCRYVPFEPMDAAAVEARIDSAWSTPALEHEGQALTLGVELQASGEVIGDVMLRWVSAEHRCAEIGYVLHPAHAGRGYATEAGHALLHLGFDGLGAHRVIARIDARNRASIAVARRLGMRQEAHLVENEWFKGEWSDEIDFALLEAEWAAATRDGCPSCRPA